MTSSKDWPIPSSSSSFSSPSSSYSSSFSSSSISSSVVTMSNVIMTSLPSRTPMSPGYRTAVTVVLIIVIILTVCGNLLTMVLMLYDKRLRAHRVSSLYIASLAGADLLVGAVVMTFMLLYTVTYDGRWVFGDVTCAVWTCIDYVSCTASLSNVFLIAVDRYRSVSQPLKAIRRRTRRRASWMLLIAWITPAVFWIMIICSGRMLKSAASASRVQYDVTNVTWSSHSYWLPNNSEEVDQERDNNEICDTQWSPPELAVFSVIVMFYIPLVAIFVLFGLILCVLRRHVTTITRRMRRTVSTGLDASDEEFRALRNGAVAADTDSATSESAVRINSVNQIGVRETIIDGKGGCATTTGVGERISMRVHVYHKSSSSGGAGEGRSFSGGLSSSTQVTTFVKFTSRVSVKNAGASDGERRGAAGAGERISSTFRVGSLSGGLDTGTRSESDDESSTGSSRGRQDGSRRSPRAMLTTRRTVTKYVETPHYHHRYASDMRAQRQGSLQEVRLRQQIKAAKILGAMTLFLLLCWMPFTVMLAIKAFCPSCLTQRTFDIAIWINYMNSGINPIIYCLCNEQYRLALRNLALRMSSACLRYRRNICCVQES